MIQFSTALIASVLALPAVHADQETELRSSTAEIQHEYPLPRISGAEGAEEGNLALEFLRHLPPTAAGRQGLQPPRLGALPAPLMTPPSISGFTDPEREPLNFPEAF